MSTTRTRAALGSQLDGLMHGHPMTCLRFGHLSLAALYLTLHLKASSGFGTCHEEASAWKER